MIEEASKIAVSNDEETIKEKLKEMNGQWIDNPEENGYPYENISTWRQALAYCRADRQLIKDCMKARNGEKVKSLFTDGYRALEEQHHEIIIAKIHGLKPKYSMTKDWKIQAMEEIISYSIWMAGGDLEQADRLVHRAVFFTILKWCLLMLPDGSKRFWDQLSGYFDSTGIQLTAGECELMKKAETMKKFRLGV